MRFGLILGLIMANALFSHSFMFPEAKDLKQRKVPWKEAKAQIMKGNVTHIFQAHTLEVDLVTTSGEILNTVEPRIDEIYKVVKKCGHTCADTKIATE